MSTPEPKPRLCTICKLPRLGHPRTGCPNSVVIPIVRDSSAAPTPTINIQSVPVPLGPAAGQYPYAGNPYGLSISVADPRLPTLGQGAPSRAASVKPSAEQLEEAVLHAAAPLLNNNGAGPSNTYNLARRVATPAGGDQFQWAAAAQWQLILAGHLDEAGRWIVTSRDIAPSLPQGPHAMHTAGVRGATPYPPGAMPLNAPAGPPAPLNNQATSTSNPFDWVKLVFGWLNVLFGWLKLFFAVLLGVLLGIYAVI